MRTDDPIRDMENHQVDKRPIIGRCIICGCEIHGDNDRTYGDDYWDFGEGKVCEDCLYGYIDDHKNI